MVCRAVDQHAGFYSDCAGGSDSKGNDALTGDSDIGAGVDGGFCDAARACEGKARSGASEQTR